MRNGVGGAADARRCGEYGGGTEPKMERGRYLDPRPRRSSTERNQRGGRGAGQNRGRMRRGSSGPQSGEVEDGGDDVEGEEQGARGVLTPPPSSEGAPCHDARPEKIGCATSRFRRARARHGQVSQRASTSHVRLRGILVRPLSPTSARHNSVFREPVELPSVQTTAHGPGTSTNTSSATADHPRWQLRRSNKPRRDVLASRTPPVSPDESRTVCPSRSIHTLSRRPNISPPQYAPTSSGVDHAPYALRSRSDMSYGNRAGIRPEWPRPHVRSLYERPT